MNKIMFEKKVLEWDFVFAFYFVYVNKGMIGEATKY